MSNIKHSDESAEWYTPESIIQKVHKVIGKPDLDPASCDDANQIVEARRYITEKDDGIARNWGKNIGSIFMNPPNGKYEGTPSFYLFWYKLMEYHKAGNFDHAIVVIFNLEHLCISQDCSLSMLNFDVCILRNRIKFESASDNEYRPSHANAVVYVPCKLDKSSLFAEQFKPLGQIVTRIS